MTQLPDLPTDRGLRTRVRGVEADVTFEVDWVERNRRVAVDAGPQLHFGDLASWLKIPDTSWTPASGMSAEAIHLVETHPESVEVSYTDAGPKVRRILRPAVTPLGVSVRADHWRQGLEWAGRFAGYAERTLVLTEQPPDLSAVQVEAMYFGVGLELHLTEQGREVVSHPAPFMPERFTAASWYFAEQIYSRWVEENF